MSSDTTPEKPVSAGDLLRQGRLRQRLSLGECGKRTHIAPRFLEALEEERWNDLPSESHRIGFLRTYSRFLGVPQDEVISIYEKRAGTSSANSERNSGKPDSDLAKKATSSKIRSRSFYPGSWQELVGAGGLLFLAAWVFYHTVGKRWLGDSRPYALLHPRQRAARQMPTRAPIANQKIRVTALKDTWMRVVTEDRLVFEGNLPESASKEWFGNGVFQLKLGSPGSVSVYWNDQAVDLTGLHSGAELSLPLARQNPADVR